MSSLSPQPQIRTLPNVPKRTRSGMLGKGGLQEGGPPADQGYFCVQRISKEEAEVGSKYLQSQY